MTALERGISEWLNNMSEGTMFYEIIPGDRCFNKNQLYSEIDWTNFDDVVNAFGRRIRGWYLEPAEVLETNGHFAFSVMALNCLLIDTLSQFFAGEDSSSGNTYKKFVRDELPRAYSEPLKETIKHHYKYHGEEKQTDLENVADVLYHGFRCGILHQAHITPYGLVEKLPQPVQQKPFGHVKYKRCGSPCPSVVVDPSQLLVDLSQVFDNYLANLKGSDSTHDELRTNFKNKFTRSFGVDVSSAI